MPSASVSGIGASLASFLTTLEPRLNLDAITELHAPRSRADLGPWREGDAVVAGGSWLFSEPQPGVRRLVDVRSLGWPSITLADGRLTIAATCTFAELSRWAAAQPCAARRMIAQCCGALQGSFKIANAATVGGNICTALPAGPMIALAAALDAECLIWRADGGEETRPVTDVVLGPHRTGLAPGDLLRALVIDEAVLDRPAAFRKASLHPFGRSAALLIGVAHAGGLRLVVTAATPRPIVLDLATAPDRAGLAAALEVHIPPALYLDDHNGDAAWRRRMTHLSAAAIIEDLAA